MHRSQNETWYVGYLKNRARVFEVLSEDHHMSTFTSSAFRVAVEPAEPVAVERLHRRRRISPQAGRALEMLGHAIEYLADEYMHEGQSFTPHNPQLEAIQLLMARNREVYFSCPEIPTIGERFRSFLHGL